MNGKGRGDKMCIRDSGKGGAFAQSKGLRQARGIYLKISRVCPAEGGRAQGDGAACAVCHLSLIHI